SLPRPGRRQFDQSGDFLVTRSSMTACDSAERSAPRISLTDPGRRGVRAAKANGTAAALVRRPGGVLTLSTALASLPDPVEPGLHVPDLEQVKPLTTQARNDIEPHKCLLGYMRQVGFNHIREPTRHVLTDRRHLCRHGARPCPGMQCDPSVVDLLTRRAV